MSGRTIQGTRNIRWVILQDVKLCHHGLVHPVDFPLDMVANARSVHQVGDVIPGMSLIWGKFLNDLLNLDAMTKGKACLVLAVPRNSCQPFSEELKVYHNVYIPWTGRYYLSQWWLGSPFLRVPYTKTRCFSTLFWEVAIIFHLQGKRLAIIAIFVSGWYEYDKKAYNVYDKRRRKKHI